MTTILTKEESLSFIATAADQGIKVVTHPMGGCSAWQGHHYMGISARHYGSLKAKLERKGYL